MIGSGSGTHPGGGVFGGSGGIKGGSGSGTHPGGGVLGGGTYGGGFHGG